MGKRIKILRIKKEFTQEEFSELIGISQRALSAIECGRSFVTAETLEKIIEKLEVNPDELFAFKYLKPSDDLIKEIIADIEKLKDDKEKIEIIYKIIKSFF